MATISELLRNLASIARETGDFLRKLNLEGDMRVLRRAAKYESLAERLVDLADFMEEEAD